MPGPSRPPVRIWDLPTRLFHWALVVCVIGLLVTGKIGGPAMPWHARIGYTVAALLLFRLAWGLVGGHWSRFRSFVFSPRVLVDYLRGTADPATTAGHTPLGAGSVFALLIFLLAQVASGLFSDDREEFAGPLSLRVSNQTARLFTAYHKDIGEVVLIFLVLLHVGAIAYYHLRKKQDLVGPMWHGDKSLAFEVPASRDDARTRWLAAALLAACSAAVAGLVFVASR